MKYFLLVLFIISYHMNTSTMQKATRSESTKVRLRTTTKGDSSPEENRAKAPVINSMNSGSAINYAPKDFSPVNNNNININHETQQHTKSSTSSQSKSKSDSEGGGVGAAMACGAVGVAGVAGIAYAIFSCCKNGK